MANRAKSKLSKSRKSALRVEALEQRQLLATISAGTGAEVGADIVHSNGNVYDQVLLQGSSVTVNADAGQVTRVSFLDVSGDIVQAEFAGSGTLTVSLSGATGPAAPTEYDQPGVSYMQGLASFTIQGSDATTNFSVFSVGTANAFLGAANPIFGAGAHDGGNNFADVARIVIHADPNSPVGNSFGGIRAGNAIFADTQGAVGIAAPDIQFTGPIVIGDLDASSSATPILAIGGISDNKTITVAGGDLKQTNAKVIQNDEVALEEVAMQSGTSSNGTLLETQIMAGSFSEAVADVSYASSAAAISIDGSTVTQTELNAYKTKFLGDVTIENGLKAGLTFAAYQFGNVTVNGNLEGLITTDVDGLNDVDTAEQAIGSVTVTGDIKNGGGIEGVRGVGAVTVTGKTTHTVALAGGAGVISTLAGSVGNVSFGNDVSVTAAESLIVAVGGGIGAVSGTNLTLNNAHTAALISSAKAIGALTFTGDVSITNTDGTAAAINAAGGNIGNISAKSLALNETNANAVNASKAIGSVSVTNGALTLTSGLINASDGGIGAISAAKSTAGATDDILIVGASSGFKATKNIGDISVTSKGEIEVADGGQITSTAGSIGSIYAKEGNVTLDVVSAKTAVGNITLDKGSLGFVAGGQVVTTSIASGASIGAVTVKGGSITGNDGVVEFLSNKIGDVSVTGASGTGTLLTNVIFSAKGVTQADVLSSSIGNVTLNAAANTAGVVAAATVVATDADSGTGFSASGNIGNVTVTTATTGKVIADATSSLVIRAGNSGMGADTDALAAGVANAGLAAADKVTAVSIGDITVNANLSTGSISPANAAGVGLLIGSGVDLSANGVFASGAGNAAIDAPTALTAGSIGTLTLNDVNGGIYATLFNNSAVQDDGAVATTGASAIAADSIAKIIVNGAVELRNVTPTGNALKGVIGNLPSVNGTDNTFVGGNAQNLFVVVI